MHMLVNQDHSKPAVFWNLHTSAYCPAPISLNGEHIYLQVKKQKQ